MLLWILLILLLVLALGGGWQYPTYGAWGFSPVGVVLVVLIILLLTGRL